MVQMLPGGLILPFSAPLFYRALWGEEREMYVAGAANLPSAAKKPPSRRSMGDADLNFDSPGRDFGMVHWQVAASRSACRAGPCHASPVRQTGPTKCYPPTAVPEPCRHFHLAGLGFHRQIAAGDVLLDELEKLRRFYPLPLFGQQPVKSAFPCLQRWDFQGIARA